MALEVVTVCATAAAAGISLKIRLAQSDQALKTEQHNSALKAELTARDEKTARDLEVHQAEDRQQFREVMRSLDRLETK